MAALKSLKAIIKSVPGANLLAQVVHLLYALVKYRSARTILYSPPGHFYSPLPDLSKVKERELTDVLPCTELPGVDLQVANQLSLLREFSHFSGDVPFPDVYVEGQRYYFKNNYYGAGDAIVLYCMIRRFQPLNIIEVGSGFSSAAMLDTARSIEGYSPKLTFIDPNPVRLYGLLSAEDRQSCSIVESRVQAFTPDFFNFLSGNDFLFIDSSHVTKSGSDVNYLLFKILPSLNPGVIVHFHDIIWPFEYPVDWLRDGIAWNEAYLLRAFLSYNREFEILYFNSFIGNCYLHKLRRALPRAASHIGGSLWLRKRL